MTSKPRKGSAEIDPAVAEAMSRIEWVTSETRVELPPARRRTSRAGARKKRAGPSPDGGGASPREPGEFDPSDLNSEYALVLMGSKAVVVREQNRGPIEDRVRVLSLEAFRAKHLNQFVTINGRAMSVATAWLAHKNRRDFDGIEFFPDPDSAPGTPRYLNLWRGFAVDPQEKAGSYAIFEDHLRNNVCSGDEALFRWVFGWFAHMVQRPRERPGTSIIFRGKMGAGKTKIGEVFGSLFPSHYFMADDPRYIVGNFNAHMASCLLLQAEEAVWAGDKAAEGRLRGLVTSKIQMIEQKGIDPIRLQNYVRLIMTSNEDWVLSAGKDERRFCVLDVDPRCAQNHEYFRQMDAELDSGGREALLYDLLHFDLETVDLWSIPRTGALLEQKVRSLDSVESWWFERLSTGMLTHKHDRWSDLVQVEAVYEDYVATTEKIGVRRKAEAVAFGMKLKRLVPSIVRSRRTTTDEDSVVRRVWCYEMPPLEECRAAFEEIVGQSVRWEDRADVLP